MYILIMLQCRKKNTGEHTDQLKLTTFYKEMEVPTILSKDCLILLIICLKHI